jgi:GR25 family glycosyltransferase involved in LPS biosynthesis
MSINDYFDKIICINLKRRPDRWAEMEIQLKKHNIRAIRFEAVDGNPMKWKPYKGCFEGKMQSFPGNMGCIASHVNIYKMAKENKWKRVLIIEDDCDFIDNLNEIFNNSINSLPGDWDLLYFGGVHETRGGVFVPEKIDEHFVKAKRIITTTCYAIKETAYDLAIKTILKDEPYFYTAIDGYLGAYIQPNCVTYSYHPPVAWQRASYSDIQKGDRDYSNMMKNNNIK